MDIARKPAILALACALVATLGCQEIRNTLVIKEDGSCELRMRLAIKRAQLEQQIRMMEMMDDGGFMGDGDAEEKEPPKLTDDQLAEKVKDIVARQSEMTGAPEIKVEKVDVEKELVRIVAKQSHESIKDMLSQRGFVQGMGMSGVVFEKDDDGRLRITLDTRQGGMNASMMRRQIKFNGMILEYRFELPGKIISSDFPETEGKATWITVEAKKNDTLDALEKLLKSDKIVVTAELGGLALDEKLDSRKLARLARPMGGSREPEMPVTDAQPGFIAEASSVTTTAIRYFPGAPKEFRDSDYEARQAGVVIQAKLFPPRERKLLSVGQAVAKSAVDDQGRKVEPAQAEGDHVSHMPMGMDDDENRAADIQVRLGLPKPDAEAIEELDGEVIATTFGAWKEHPVKELKADPAKEIDLSDILPGAKLTIRKVTDKQDSRSGGGDYTSRRGSIQLHVTGPKEVAQLSFKIEIAGCDNVNSYDSGGRSRTKDKVTTRNANVSYSAHGRVGPWTQAAPALKVRYPDEMRRERVKFKLEGLDLF